jgi:Icc-related predicted phosphoesterase
LQGKKFTRVFFATDVHGSERCFNKFLAAGRFYKADVLVLGGDITGKLVIPIVDMGNGIHKATYVGKVENASTKEELETLKNRIADSGYYYYFCGKSEMDDLQSSKEKVDQLFVKVMKETLARWVEYAEQVLKETNTPCYITGGNDDMQEVVDEIRDTEHVKNPENKLVKLDPIHEMASMGWSNITPWKCPRDCSEEELESHIEKVMADVQDTSNLVFNFHTPPINCGLDTVQKLDDSVYPPKPVLDHGQPILVGAGSESVKKAIEKYQPLLDLCGHIHEARGMCKIGRTHVINPGSEYSEGILRGAILNLADKKVLSWQLTSG